MPSKDTNTQTGRNISRRTWFGITLFGGAGLVIAPPLLEHQPHQIIKTILSNKLPGAQIPDSTYMSFIEAYLKTDHYTGAHKAYRVFSSLAWMYPTGVLHRLPTFGPKMKLMEETVITHFTMSTNFFHDTLVQTGQKPVLFISYWRLRACNNPFAVFEAA